MCVCSDFPNQTQEQHPHPNNFVDLLFVWIIQIFVDTEI